jgi:hypothetical protein
MSENPSSEIWNNALRLGLFRSMNHYRGLLLRGQALTQDDREGLIDLLNLQEEYMAITWPEAAEPPSGFHPGRA